MKEVHMDTLEKEIAETAKWMSGDRFRGVTRLYSARQVVEQRGTIRTDYTVARTTAEGFFARLRELFAARQAITTFGPYSPGQAVVMKRAGIQGIYLGGWATSAKGSSQEDPGPDLASYPLSQVPEEAAPIIRALLAADKNQSFLRARMSQKQRETTPEYDYRPFMIADADTGHGGEAHVRNLIRRFAEVGVPGYHIEDQKPGVKKCGHQGGKVLVPIHEQIQRLNAARFQLDIMQVPGIIVARTDAEAATLLDGNNDERDHAFILGATNRNIPSFRVASLAILRRFTELGVRELGGHLLHRVSAADYESAYAWFKSAGLLAAIDEAARTALGGGTTDIGGVLDSISSRFVDVWQAEAGLKTYGEAVAGAMAFELSEGRKLGLSVEEWLEFASSAGNGDAREKARSLGVNVTWDWELPRAPEGYFPIVGGIEYAITRSLAVAPFADLLWMETKTANVKEARHFADAIHAKYPDKMLAYNLSPSFSWDTTGMSETEMTEFPKRLGELGYVFDFITYGGHQVDGLAADEFATALRQDGMLALARLQRKLRLIESPYRLPQTHVGGPRSDAALMASSGGTATTKSMGKGSTQVQHLVQTEVPASVLEKWLAMWTKHHNLSRAFTVELKPHTAGSELLALTVLDESKTKVASVIFATIKDRRDRSILSVRDQSTFETSLRRKRLMTLLHLFLIHRYKIVSVHYVTPTEDNQKQTAGMKALGVFDSVHEEVGQIIVASVNTNHVRKLVDADQVELRKLITKSA
jgi:isocitrate lyase